ncbi:TIGR01212 family radical SAM protein [Proteocatella sphenisci]|uniref:TIGR01212 family radical SAM protein n=1 Tax=Proteocatella sphenisci TaxID=181070 RepID=UPI0004909D4D|nr:TIGR01212 family radical SAM protein [Proteocatella sphenisci]
MSNTELYSSLNSYLRSKFGCKVIKLSIDGGFSCPNRDGSLAYGGCIFCSEEGSGEFSGDRKLSITQQMKDQSLLLETKWPESKYIAYFQNFTNTYDNIDSLRKKYDEALAFPNVVGIAIATRPDCLSIDVLSLLSEYNSKTFLWVELGLQTIHEKTADFIRRGYGLRTFDTAMKNLNSLKIKTVSHIILNLPGENFDDMRNTLEYISSKQVWGVKLQMLNILKNTDLEKHYLSDKFYLRSADEYIELISNLITYLPPHMVIHRITGDGKKESLLAPLWVLDKRYVLNGIQKYMRLNNLYQSKNYLDIC